jgi:Zn-dependent metalloprotease
VYANESGALNEAFADIFGTSIEHFAVPEYADWLMGAACGLTIRNTQNPKALGNPNAYKGQYWDAQTQQVHNNSTPFSHWFYLITEGGSGTNDFGNSFNVAGLGISKSEQIAFKLLTQYLTPNSGYEDAYFLGAQVAANLFGGCSDEVKSVGDAFYANRCA